MSGTFDSSIVNMNIVITLGQHQHAREYNCKLLTCEAHASLE